MMGVVTTTTPITPENTMPRYYRIVGPEDPILNRNAVTPDILKNHDCANLTQFAEHIGVHRTTLARAYTGAINVGAKLLTSIAATTGASVDQIITKHPPGTRLYLPGTKNYDPGHYPEITVRGRT